MLRRGALDLEDRYYGNARIFREEQLAGLLHTYDPQRSFRDVTDPIYAQTTESWTRSPACSTSTCSPGCAATSWSRPTR